MVPRTTSSICYSRMSLAFSQYVTQIVLQSIGRLIPYRIFIAI